MTTNMAGGNPNELRMGYNPSAFGYHRFISPAFDSRYVHDMSLEFNYKLDDYSGTANTYTFGVQISHDLVNWNWVWQQTTGTSIPPTYILTTIPYTSGMSQTTYIAFTFYGDNNDIDNWYIDNILLGYQNSLGIGIWPVGSYFPVGNLIIPDTQSLTLQAGTSLQFTEGKGVTVNGRLQVNGTDTDRVYFASVNPETGYWGGISFPSTASSNGTSQINFADIGRCSSAAVRVVNFNYLQLRDCVIWGCQTTDTGGGLYFENSNCDMERCVVDNNSSTSAGGGIYLVYCPLVRITDTIISYNHAENFGSAIYSMGSMDVLLTRCKIANNTTGTISSVYGAVEVRSSTVTLDHCLIANNSCSGIYTDNSQLTVINSDIVRNFKGVKIAPASVFTVILNSIVYYHENSIFNDGNSLGIAIDHSCIENGLSGVTGNGINPINYTYNTSSSPLFIDPSFGYGADYSGLSADWSLQYNSPCINAGPPSYPYDPDGTIADIGLYSRQLCPIVSAIADVTPDQGHQLDLTWQSSDIDVSFNPNAFYSVWRQSLARESGGIELNSPAELPQMVSDREQYYWREGDRTWYYVGQVPAMNFTGYGLVVPTIQDSSSTGTHAVELKVAYHNNNGMWLSTAQSGYSVDNIPPDAPGGLILNTVSPSQLNLSWQAVTQGLWEGNSYPEVNQITYKIHAADSPDFIPSPTNLILQTTNPQAILTLPSSDYKFYRIIANDSQ
jgi:hypothetical protein